MLPVILTAPLVCWALLARTRRTGVRYGVILAVCVIVQIVAAEGLILAHYRDILITAVSLITIPILLWGVATEHDNGAPALWRTSRGLAGLTVTVLYCTVCAVCAVYVVLLLKAGFLGIGWGWLRGRDGGEVAVELCGLRCRVDAELVT